MATWHLHEQSKLGGEGAVWQLVREKELFVGRSPDCGVNIQSKSVDDRHAVFKWDSRNVSYMLKDLGSVNGTYVNHHPLRGTSVVLKHNDAIRFGYDKEHGFRMEECFTPASKGNPMSPLASTSPTHSTTSTVTPPPSTALQYVAVSAPAVQALSPKLAISHPLQNSLLQQQQPLTQSTTPTSPSHPQGMPLVGHALPLPDDEGEGLSNWSHRSDGRRTVDLENSPALNSGSRLYGQPLWWGERQGEGQEAVAKARDREFDFVKPGSQILRHLDPEVKRDVVKDKDQAWVVDIGGGAAVPPRLRRSRDFSSRSRSADPSPNRLTAKRDASPVSKRAVTPGPTSTTKRHSASFRTTPTTRKQRATTPPTAHPTGALSRKSLLGNKSNPKNNKTRSATLPHSKSTTPKSSTPHSKIHPQSGGSQSTPVSPHSRTPRSPGSRARGKPSAPVAEVLSKAIDIKTLNDEGKVDDNTYTRDLLGSSEESLSSLSDQNISLSEKQVVVVTPADSRVVDEPVATARKLWTDENTEASADSLMMASIEARMRGLSKLAHQTSQQATTLKSTIQDGHQVEVRSLDYLSLRDTSPVVIKAEEHLPEWKFFNKEASSIFRNIRVVEKWLHDIDGTLNSIKPVQNRRDSADFASDGELYLDSIDNLDKSGSED